MSKRIRPIEFHVQPVLAADDGETLHPVKVEPFTIPAVDWETYAAECWPVAVAKLEADLNADDIVEPA